MECSPEDALNLLDSWRDHCEFNREFFLQRYHKRSNVETTFSMIKAKLGDGLRSESQTAQVNEALCKVLCHNLVCVIQSIFELGIEPTFWAGSQTPPVVR